MLFCLRGTEILLFFTYCQRCSLVNISSSIVSSGKTNLRLGCPSLCFFIFMSSSTFWETRDYPEPAGSFLSSLPLGRGDERPRERGCYFRVLPALIRYKHEPVLSLMQFLNLFIPQLSLQLVFLRFIRWLFQNTRLCWYSRFGTNLFYSCNTHI